MSIAGTKHIGRLADGRRVGYAEYGAADGRPVLALHGTPGSRLKFAPAHRTAVRHRIRLIAVDRWGYGDSAAPKPPMSLDAYAGDLADLADALAIGRFGLLGISGGGPFAAVAAGRLGQRVERLALIAPVGPIAGEHRLVMDAAHRFSFGVLPRVPGLTSTAFHLYRALLRVSPRLGARVAAARGPRADRQILGDAETAVALANAFRLGLRDGTTGPVIDLRLFARPWPPLDLACEARMWLGTLDRNVPRAAALHLADAHRIDVTTLNGAGHFWFAHNAGDVLAWLAGAQGR
jgi:pimeloyl-ACP methyl ester carboxylesterase